MDVKDIVKVSILNIGESLERIIKRHEILRTNLLSNETDSKHGILTANLIYEVRDIYATIADDRFFLSQYFFFNNLLGFGHFQINFQRKLFSLLIDHFNNNFNLVSEDNWTTQDGNTIIKIKYADKYSPSTIYFYSPYLVPAIFWNELHI